MASRRLAFDWGAQGHDPGVMRLVSGQSELQRLRSGDRVVPVWREGLEPQRAIAADGVAHPGQGVDAHGVVAGLTSDPGNRIDQLPSQALAAAGVAHVEALHFTHTRLERPHRHAAARLPVAERNKERTCGRDVLPRQFGDLMGEVAERKVETQRGRTLLEQQAGIRYRLVAFAEADAVTEFAGCAVALIRLVHDRLPHRGIGRGWAPTGARP